MSSEALSRLRASIASRYGVERELGRGGMATVYLARDLKHDREVAIKVVHPELAASMGGERFLREINITAKLSHPHILPLYDSGEADGFLFYVMPFVDGETLRDRLNRDQLLPMEEAVQIAREVSDALSYAHQEGVVHRDIKPENILLKGGHALVADFGVGRAAQAAGAEQLTQTGMAVGTPAYMSPEQATGSDRVDGRSDIYGLGCVLYEMLVGQAPFTGPTPLAVLAKHSLEDVPRMRIIRSAIPDELEAVVTKSLAKLPVDRYRSAKEFSDALILAVGATPTPLGPWGKGKPRPTVGFRKKTATALTGIGLAVVLGWAVTEFAGRGSPTPDPLGPGGMDRSRIAVLYFEDQSPDGDLGFLAQGLTESLIDRLALVRGLDLVSSNGVAQFLSTELPRDSIARTLRAGTLVEGSVEEVGDRYRVTARLVEGASGAELNRQAIEGPKTDLLSLRDSLAVEVARFVRGSLGRELELQAIRSGASNSDAWSLVLRAEPMDEQIWSWLDLDSMDLAVTVFEERDSLLSLAESLDSEWPVPPMKRAFNAYKRSQWMGTSDRVLADEWSQEGLRLVERALALDPSHPGSLEVRGTLSYWRWLLNLAVDPEEAARLFADAESDLREAVAQNRGQATAWDILSHLLLNKAGGRNEARLAARRAFEADSYFQNIEGLIDRLHLSSYDLEDFIEADHWCQVGADRFPENPKFRSCQIWVMSMVGSTPDIDRAWQMVEEYVELNPEQWRPYRRRQGELAAAAVLARANLPDSARAVVLRSLGSREVDPSRETYMSGAFVMVLLNDHEAAVRLLTEWVSANPNRAVSLVNDDYWWWRDLQGRADFQALATMGAAER